jgi:dipeptidyl aminopeptidase/acylaminoacyl peptidase
MLLLLALLQTPDLITVSDPRLRPDGSQVAFVRGQADLARNRNSSDIVVLATATGRTLQSWAGSNPRWSPDGTRIAWLGEREGKSGIWIRDLAAGSDRFLVPAPQSDAWLGRGAAKNFEWSPDGKWIAFVAADSAAAPSTDVKAFSRIMYKTRTGFTDDRRTHLYLVPAEGGASRALTAGRFDEHSIAWAPDSRRLAFVSDRSADPDNSFANDLYSVDVGTGALTQLTRTPTAEFSPVWSPDGQWIAYEAWVRVENTKDSPAEDTKAYLMPAGGGTPRRLAPALDRRITEVGWHPSGRQVYFTAGDRGANRIYRVGLGDSAPDVVVGGAAQARAYQLDRAGTGLVFVRTDFTRPAELFHLDLATGRERPLTALNAVSARHLPIQDATEFWFTSFDGTPVQGWVMRPAGFQDGRTYPAILNVHGGPHGAFGFAFSDRFQQQAAAGYGVVFINPRGSSGYGQAFSDGSLLNWGGGDYRDLMIGLDTALARNRWIDPARLGVTGGSYGGFMTNWIVTQTPRFKAAVASASVSNLISFYGTSLYTDLIEAEFRGLPWDNYPMLWQWSPLAHVKGVTTPTLFLHGENDHDVPVTQAEEMYTALRKQGVEATLVRYPNEGHGLRQPRHVADSNRRLLAWFDRYLKPTTTP